MLHAWLADGVLALHLAFILFVVCGGLLVLRWPRLAWIHLPAAAWGVLIEYANWICPLTPLEVELRRRGGREGYTGTFLEHYLEPVVYPSGLTREAQILLGSFVLGVNVAVYAWLLARRRRHGSGRAAARDSRPTGEGGPQMRAWLLLVGALALHVIDEASTGFLDFYNPLVQAIRDRVWWFPMPTFAFGPWLAGLGLLVLVLASLAPAVRRGAPGTRIAAWGLSVIMLLNGIGHLAGSMYWQRWLPGATTAPLLIAAGLLLARRTRRRLPARVC